MAINRIGSRYTGVRETLQSRVVRGIAALTRSDIAMLSGPQATEIYLTIMPSSDAPPQDQAEAVWSATSAILDEHDAYLLEERVFLADPAVVPLFRACRGVWMQGRDADVEPAWLIAPDPAGGAFSGVLVRAVAGGAIPRAIRADGRSLGRVWRCGTYEMFTGIAWEGRGDTASEQARDVFRRVDDVLQSGGWTWREVSRTWFWLRRILDWYGEFNAVRTDFFRERKVIAGDEAAALPASTGIGVSPASGRHVVLDFVVERGTTRKDIRRTPRQGDAYRYGSAFSRGVVLDTPFGPRAYVSGTASIGPDGRTRFVGDPHAQIEETLACVRAVLCEAFGGARPRIVQAVAYCKTPEVEHLFRAFWQPQLGPCLVVRADVCRPELLFELECIAGV